MTCMWRRAGSRNAVSGPEEKDQSIQPNVVTRVRLAGVARMKHRQTRKGKARASMDVVHTGRRYYQDVLSVRLTLSRPPEPPFSSDALRDRRVPRSSVCAERSPALCMICTAHTPPLLAASTAPVIISPRVRTDAACPTKPSRFAWSTRTKMPKTGAAPRRIKSLAMRA